MAGRKYRTPYVQPRNLSSATRRAGMHQASRTSSLQRRILHESGWRVSLPFLLLAGLIIVRPSDSRKRERIISISLSARRLSSIWAFKAWRSDHAAEGTINRLIES